MKEIKFRAWDKKGKNWFTSSSSVKTITSFDSLGFLEIMADEDLIWMQYTGLKDKNGKEIYEGDIVKITTTFNTFPVSVIWDKDAWSFSDDGTYGTLSEWNENCEIIGNIYENPELLK